MTSQASDELSYFRERLIRLSDGNTWKLKNFVVNRYGINVIASRHGKEVEVPVHMTQTSEGGSLSKGLAYLVNILKTSSGTALTFKQYDKCAHKHIQLRGKKSSLKLNGKPLSEINITVNCGTSAGFEDIPETIHIKVGDKIRIRNDSASFHNNGIVEMAGQEGLVTSVAHGGTKVYDADTTLTVKFGGQLKEYRVCRFIDKDGNFMQRGWFYMIERTQDTFVAKPVHRLPPDELSWLDDPSH